MPRLIDADAYAAEMKKRQDACMETMENASYEGEPFSPKEHWEGVLAAFAEAKLTLDDMPTVATDINVPCKWISVKSRMPAETHSIFWRLIESEKWTNAMWREQSGKVLVTVSLKDGTRYVTTGETHDGVWNTTISRTLEHEVTHWMPFPEPPKED